MDLSSTRWLCVMVSCVFSSTKKQTSPVARYLKSSSISNFFLHILHILYYLSFYCIIARSNFSCWLYCKTIQLMICNTILVGQPTYNYSTGHFWSLLVPFPIFYIGNQIGIVTSKYYWTNTWQGLIVKCFKVILPG